MTCELCNQPAIMRLTWRFMAAMNQTYTANMCDEHANQAHKKLSWHLGSGKVMEWFEPPCEVNDSLYGQSVKPEVP